MEKRVTLVWFRNDLRLHDNEILLEAVQKSSFIIPIYCFDPRYFQRDSFGNQKTGILRAAFQLENVRYLKQKFQSLGSDIMTYVGISEEVIPRIAQKYQVDEVYHHREIARRETTISDRVEAALWKSKINLKHFIGHTLYHKEDLPFPIKDIPDAFSVFKKKIERESSVRAAFPATEELNTPNVIELTELPTLLDLGYTQAEIDACKELPFVGGEEAALVVLDQVLTATNQDENNYMLLAPYIAVGSLSPLELYHSLKQAETASNKKYYDKIHDKLLWRDYYRFMLKKRSNVFFKIHGVGEHAYSYVADEDQLLFNKWKQAETGVKEIDQLMEKLNDTGYISYKGRILLASYLIQEYQVNWLAGASWFEEKLIDYSPATNYGIWAHVAGVGTSKKENKAPSWKDQLAHIVKAEPS